MKINSISILTILQALEELNISMDRYKEISSKQLEELVSENVLWITTLRDLEIQYKCDEDNTHYLINIIHDKVKPGYDETVLPITLALSGETFNEYWEFYLLECNDIFLMLTAGFYPENRKPFWKLGLMNGNAIKKLLKLH